MVPTQLVSEDQSLKGDQTWRLCGVAAGATSQGSLDRSSTPILRSVWCELSSSTRAQGGAGQSLDGPHLHAQPLLWQRVEEERRPGAAQPSVGTRGCVTVAWILLLLLLFLHCTSRDRPYRLRCSPHHSSSAQNPEFWFPFLAAFPKGVCVGKFPVPACADPAALPVCISGKTARHLHLGQWLQCWQLLHTLVPAEASEPSSVSLILLLRLK